MDVERPKQSMWMANINYAKTVVILNLVNTNQKTSINASLNVGRIKKVTSKNSNFFWPLEA